MRKKRAKTRLKRLSMAPLDVDDALKKAMDVDPPKADKRRGKPRKKARQAKRKRKS